MEGKVLGDMWRLRTLWKKKRGMGGVGEIDEGEGRRWGNRWGGGE